MEASSSANSLAFVEALYADFVRDPGSVPPEWRRWFEQLPAADGFAQQPRLGPSFSPPSVFNPPDTDGRTAARDTELAALQERVDQLIHAYRVRGHLIAQIDPLGTPRPHPPELELEFHGLSERDLERSVSAASLGGDGERQTLRRIIQRLRNTYCRSIGVQYMHIDSLTVKLWLQDRMEQTENRLDLSRDEQVRILMRLSDALVFEEFIQKKYVGAKTFSLEGAESLIPLLDLAIEKAGAQGLQEIVLGMAHRGRLNVLANVLDKSPQQIFREFEDVDSDLYVGRGDVKYHLGYSSDRITAAGHRVHLSLCFNPSHLEFVDPVAIGRMRAKQDRVDDMARERGMVLLIHGDAAFAAEGIVQETLNLSELRGYTVGGTLHVIVNNLIGFTTPPCAARSSVYATDVAKMLQIPIFHVNGEDPEAVAQVVRLGMDFRLKFKRDVVIDMYCYRRLGHNEGDEPSFTQPLLYQAIAKRPSVREGYLQHLLALPSPGINAGALTRAEADRIAAQRRAHLDEELSVARSEAYVRQPEMLHGV
ncbi:MAG TPA: thiamine pyrophosphate-dependent enzyme, partial [Phycisphaerae bacterium]